MQITIWQAIVSLPRVEINALLAPVSLTLHINLDNLLQSTLVIIIFFCFTNNLDNNEGGEKELSSSNTPPYLSYLQVTKQCWFRDQVNRRTYLCVQTSGTTNCWRRIFCACSGDENGTTRNF